MVAPTTWCASLTWTDPLMMYYGHVCRLDRGPTDINSIKAVCPMGADQICYLTGDDLVVVSEARDMKGTLYLTTGAFRPKPQQTTKAVASTVEDDGQDITLASTNYSLITSTFHGQKYIAVSIDGQIWFSKMHNQPLLRG